MGDCRLTTCASQPIGQSSLYSTTFTCDQYAHHVVMDAFLNANNSENKDLREWKLRRSDEQDVLISSSSGNGRFQIFVFRVICIYKSVHHDVVGILVTSESSWSITNHKPIISLLML